MRKYIFILIVVLMPTLCFAGECWNDNECAYNEVCECPSSKGNGNCDSVGKCVPDGKDWQILKNDMQTLIQEKNTTTKKCKKYREKCWHSDDCCGNMYCVGGSGTDRWCREIGDK